MGPEAGDTPGSRIHTLLRHFDLERAHVAGCMSGDWGDLVAPHADLVASLTLVCPVLNKGIPDAVERLASPVLVVAGDQGQAAERARELATRIPNAALLTLENYFGPIWADPIADRAEEIGAAMLDFLAQADRKERIGSTALPEGDGEVAGLFYRIQGAGPPLILLPIALARSQWDPLLRELGERYCTITLGGPLLGMISLLEERARSGYGRLVEHLLERVHLTPGETVLDVGCGSGALDRALARRTGGANRIVATDINPYLLVEARRLAEKEGLEHSTTFHEADAEALPFPEASFDVAVACTVLEEGNADRMLSELVRITKPGGRIAVTTRATDMDWWANLPLPAALQRKINGLGPRTGAGVAEHGCADASLYRRLSEAGLVQMVMFPEFAIYAKGERLSGVLDRLMTPLAPEEALTCRQAAAEAAAEGTLFVAEPFHCAVGTKPHKLAATTQLCAP